MKGGRYSGMPNPLSILFYPFTALALAIFAYGLYRRWQLWVALGKPEMRMDNLSRSGSSCC